MSINYLITDTQDGETLYWNNCLGWVDDQSEADIFSINDLNLPMGNNPKWIKTEDSYYEYIRD